MRNRYIRLCYEFNTDDWQKHKKKVFGSFAFLVDPKNPRVEVVIEDYEGGKPCYDRKGKN